jgi:hypothetical protein
MFVWRTCAALCSNRRGISRSGDCRQHSFITVINLSADLWRLDPATLLIFNPASGHGRRIRGGPLVNLVKPFDDVRQQRRPGGLDVYLKFSLAANGMLIIVLVSCHSSR